MNLLAEPAKLSSLRHLDREGARARVAAHIAGRHPVEELGIERNRPADSKDFAFVGMAPKRSSQSNWYRCSFCQRDRQLAAGRIVLSSDNFLRLIGDDCWNQYLDTDRFAEEREDWEDYKRRQNFDSIRERISPAITTAAAGIRKALQELGTELQFVENLPRTLREGAPVLYKRLEASRRLGGQLQVERMIRDYATERIIYQIETVHRVLGLDAIFREVIPDFEIKLKEGLRLLYSGNNRIKDTDWDSVGNRTAAKTINNISADVRKTLDILENCTAAINKTCDFLSGENIAGMVRWASDEECDFFLEDDASIRLVSDGLQYKTGFMLRRPLALRRNPLPDTEELKRLLNLTGG